MDNIAILTAAAYLVVFLACWFIFEHVMRHVLNFLMPWALKALSGILAALFVWRFCVVNVSL